MMISLPINNFNHHKRKIEKDPAILKWLSNYLMEYRESKLFIFADFYKTLQGNAQFKDLTPSQLVEFQQNAPKSNEFALLDALQDYIKAKSGTYSSLLARYSTSKVFFKKNRAPLPDDDFRISPDREPSGSRLSVDVIKTLIDNVGLGQKAFYLTLWMGLLDLERFRIFNERCGSAITGHLKKNGPDVPFLFEFSGRKETRGRTRCYTFIGRDALAAWNEYFERRRGWPSEGEPILLDRFGRAYDKKALRMYHLRLLEKLNFIKREAHTSVRYGYNLHEYRDVARTLLHLQGKRDGLDSECVEFWMGHVTDPNKYDKFYMDKDYVLEHYRIAEKHLNIISGGIQSRQFSNVEEMIDQIILNKPAFDKLKRALEEKMGLTPVRV